MQSGAEFYPQNLDIATMTLFSEGKLEGMLGDVSKF